MTAELSSSSDSGSIMLGYLGFGVELRGTYKPVTCGHHELLQAVIRRSSKLSNLNPLSAMAVAKLRLKNLPTCADLCLNYFRLSLSFFLFFRPFPLKQAESTCRELARSMLWTLVSRRNRIFTAPLRHFCYPTYSSRFCHCSDIRWQILRFSSCPPQRLEYYRPFPRNASVVIFAYFNEIWSDDCTCSMNVAVILPADHQQIMKKMRLKFEKIA